MMRTSALRLAAQAPALRTTTTRRSRQVVRAQRSTIRSFADAAGHNSVPPPPPSQPVGGGNTGMFIVLGALVALGGAGYVYLKPVRDVAAKANQAVDTVKSGAGQSTDLVASLAKSVLPPGVFSVYTALAQTEGGINGLLSSLKDQDIQGVLNQLKSAGGEDVQRVVAKVENKLKAANGKVQNVDWKSLAEELKKELPESSQKYVDMMIGQIPSKEDYDQFVSKLQKAGKEKTKEIEAAASKVMQQVEKAKKEGKGTADAYLKGLKEAAPADVDALIQQIKDAAKSAGLPADMIESWIKSKAEDGKVDVEAMAKNLESKLKTASKFLPGEPKDIVDQVKQFSPSMAGLLGQALQQAGIVDEKLNRTK